MFLKNLLLAAALATAAAPAFAAPAAHPQPTATPLPAPAGFTRPQPPFHLAAGQFFACIAYPRAPQPYAMCRVEVVQNGVPMGITGAMYYSPSGQPLDQPPSMAPVQPTQVASNTTSAAPPAHHLQHSPTDECEADQTTGNAYMGCYHTDHTWRDVGAIVAVELAGGVANRIGGIGYYNSGGLFSGGLNTGPIVSPYQVRGGSCGGCVRTGN